MQRARTPEARAQKKDRILKAARSLFLEQGFQSTKIDAIMKKAGLSTGTYYLYFNTKTDIFKELLSEAITILEELFEEALGWSGPSSKERLMSLVRAYLDFFHQKPEYFDILALFSVQSKEMRERSSKIGKEIEEKNIKILRGLERIIASGFNWI